MVVGIVSMELHMPGICSLKEKRGVVKRVVERVRSRFPVSIAEVGYNDVYEKSIIGFSVVSNDARLVESIMNKVFDFVENLYLADIFSIEKEIVHIKHPGGV